MTIQTGPSTQTQKGPSGSEGPVHLSAGVMFNWDVNNMTTNDYLFEALVAGAVQASNNTHFLTQSKIAQGHVWKLDPISNEVDTLAYDDKVLHNGPECIVCGYHYCMHCHDAPSISCEASQAYIEAYRQRERQQEQQQSDITTDMIRAALFMILFLDND